MSVYRPKYRDPKSGELKQVDQWWYEFTYDGKRFREPAKTTRKTIAQEAEKKRRLQLESAGRMPARPASDRIASVKERAAAYLKNYPANHRAKSVVFATQRLAHVKRLLGACLLSELTEDRIQEYIRTRLGEGAGGRTINMEVGELSRAMRLKWSIAWPSVRKLEENHDVGRALSPEEEKKLLSAAAADKSSRRNPMFYAFLQIALTTGMRSGEISTLKWGQIDFEASVITVGKAKTRRGTGRQIPMNAQLKAVLEMHAAWLAHPKRLGKLEPDWYVFPGRKARKAGEKRPLDPSLNLKSVKSSWERVRTAAGVSCRLHDMRHTAATKMAEAGVPESTMLAIMGHMSRSMLERYSHVRLAAKRDAVKSLSLPDLTAPQNEVPKDPPKVEISHQIV